MSHELNNSIYQIVMQMFGFARTLAHTINGGKDKKNIEKYIIAETIKELEYLLKIIDKKIFLQIVIFL